MTSNSEKVISVGPNPELLWLRNSVLRRAGFDVLSTADPNDALAMIRRGECGVLLYCHSLPSAVRQELAEACRKHCPGARIVAVTNSKMDKAEFADAFVYGVEGPEALIEAIRAG